MIDYLWLPFTLNNHSDQGETPSGRLRWRGWVRSLVIAGAVSLTGLTASAIEAQTPIRSYGMPAQLDIREAGHESVRITLKPIHFEEEFPFTPALIERDYPTPALSIRHLDSGVSSQVGRFRVEVEPDPLTVTVINGEGRTIQRLVFKENGTVGFQVQDAPVLGMGPGGPRPQPGSDWREEPIEFDRRGRFHNMHPRWQANAYGSRNPVPLLVGTDGWALWFATPWGRIDLEFDNVEERTINEGLYIPRDRTSLASPVQDRAQQHRDEGQGIPPLETMYPGVYDLFVFDAGDPAGFMKDLSELTGPTVLPPKWALGYMQSHRTLEDEHQMIDIVDTFREKEIPVDAVIYLGTGFTPRGWNENQPSYQYNPEVFKRDPRDVIADLHERNVKVILHMIPWSRNRLPTLQGTIPPQPGEILDASHIDNYWQEHVDLVNDGIDGWWPDEGDWFNLWERMKRHQMYYEGPISTTPNVRPWNINRNGHLGIARWGGWIWSGDTTSTWKTLEGQIAVGLNHSLSLSPWWGSDIGGFYPTTELTGELFARWFQFAAFTPSFRSHGRTWWTRLPWGWGLIERGPLESNTPPLESEMNNPEIEPVTKKFTELRYQLQSYVYSLAWQARETGLPLMRAMWLHYPNDDYATSLGDQYLWGRDILVAPVYQQGAENRALYLPEGLWYDWWSHEPIKGGRTVSREVDLTIMPLYARAGAIIPIDPIRQYSSQVVDEPITLKIFRGADGEFTLYDDDGVNLEYLNGQGTWIGMEWNDTELTLTLRPAAPDGSAPIHNDREFEIELIPDGERRSVTWTDEEVTVTF